MSENYGAKIAEVSLLKTNSIKLNAKKPFTWTSGYNMPIYNDNRRLLGNAKHRRLVTDGFKDLIEQKNISFDVIIGTSTSGIAPATSVALEFQVPLVIFHEEKPYMFIPENMDFESGILNHSSYFYKNIDAIASTCPWAIPAGVALANMAEKSFLYVRKEPKDHGMEQQIEGVFRKNENALLLDFYMNESYIENAQKALEKEGMIVKTAHSENISKLFKPANISGAKALVIEDLISFGGSSAEELVQARNNGANVEWCLSIFSYGIKDAFETFKNLNPEGKIDSILSYDLLLQTAISLLQTTKDVNYLNKNQQLPEQLKILHEWREDPKGWGEKHGFPRIIKGDKK